MSGIFVQLRQIFSRGTNISIDGNDELAVKGIQRPTLLKESRSSYSTPKSLPYATLRTKILELHAAIALLPSLDPCPEVNTLFSALVGTVSKAYVNAGALTKAAEGDADLQAILPSLILLCARSEGRMERWWALRVARPTEQKSTAITEFPYYGNYQQLARLEHNFLIGLGAHPRFCLFIGSGPLPLTSALLAQEHLIPRWGEAGTEAVEKDCHEQRPWKVTNVDIDGDANEKAVLLCATAFPSLKKGNFDFVTSSALDLPSELIYAHDTIYLAALVGLSTESKLPIIRHIVGNMHVGAQLVVRSADGLRSLIYPKLDEGEILAAGEGMLELEAVLHPRNQVVNSVIVLRRV